MEWLKLPGGRIVKTAIAIFITAWICHFLNWPAVFAVITATVTIEPTVSESIKKGIIRFPASAIGSAYAVLFISLFGNSPITYTLAAFFTITTCYRFDLHAGLLVATLTAIAMIEVVHSNYLIAFFIRLGTTTIGLFVSTAINLFVLPPNYKNDIIQNMQGISNKTSKIMKQFFYNTLMGNNSHHTNQLLIVQLKRRVQQTEKLIQFQEDEARFHPLLSNEKQLFETIKHKLTHLNLISYHLENLHNTSSKNITWTEDESQIIIRAVSVLSQNIQNITDFDLEKHNIHLNTLMKLFWEKDKKMIQNNQQFPIYLPPELILLYELLSMYNLVFKMHGDPQI